MCGTYVPSAVGLEEVLVAGGFVGHVLFGVGILTEVSGWCASEPVGFVAAPAFGEVRDVALRLQVHTEQRITFVVERQESVLFRFCQRVFAKLLGGREPQGGFRLRFSVQLGQFTFFHRFTSQISGIKRLFRRRVFCTVAPADILHGFLQREQGRAVVLIYSRNADLISRIGEGVMRACAVFTIEIEGEECVLFGADQCTEKPRSEEAACIGLRIGRGGFRSVKSGSDVHRDSAQLRDSVGLREGELGIVGVDERDVEWIVLRRGVGRRKRPGNWWTAQVQKRSAVMLDTVVVGVTVREDRRPVVGCDTVDRWI